MMPRSASEGADDDFIAKGRPTPRVFLLSLFLFSKATPSTHKTILLGSDSHLPNHASTRSGQAPPHLQLIRFIRAIRG